MEAPRNVFDAKSLIASRERLKQLEAEFFKRALEEGALYLNLGSGRRVLQGFVNVDRYTVLPSMLKADIYRLPIRSETADGLFSAHSLEHLPIRRARLALKDWYRILKPAGTLLLSMPDIDIIMAMLLRKDLPVKMRQWYMHTLFGYQTDMESNMANEDPPVDPGQFHTCGYSKRTLMEELEGIGYKIQECENYEGYGTPGVYVVASK